MWRSWWGSWFRVVTAAEFAGFIAPATAGALTADGPAGVSATALLVAGAVEGAMLGWGQATVLRRVLPDFDRARWIAATAVGAVVAYAAGLLTPMVRDRAPSAVFVATLVLAGTVMLSALGGAQWLVLRRHVRRAGRWVGVTAAAWAVALAAFAGVTSPLWHEGQPSPLVIAIGVLGGLVMAAVSSALTGFGLRWVLYGQWSSGGGPVSVSEPAPAARARG